MKVVNEKRANQPEWVKRVELKVVVCLDPVPGAWHQPEDFVEYFAQHSYVQSVELVEENA